MSTGPEHYREAERLITTGYADNETMAALVLAKAQVHATLAQAAATALGVLTHQEIELPFGVDDTETQGALNDWHATITFATEGGGAQ